MIEYRGRIWVQLLCLFAMIVHLQNRHRNRELMPYVTATMMSVAVFFLSLLTFDDGTQQQQQQVDRYLDVCPAGE